MSTTPIWANFVERVMSVLNFGLQGIVLAREVMDEEYEKEFKKCNGISAVRKLAREFETVPTVACDVEPMLAEGRDIELDVVAERENHIFEDGDGIAATNEMGVDETLLTEGRDDVATRSEVHITEDGDGIAATIERGVDEPLLSDVRDVQLDVDARSEVPIIEDGDCIAATNEKAFDEPLLT
jgi:hypothetical protein